MLRQAHRDPHSTHADDSPGKPLAVSAIGVSSIDGTLGFEEFFALRLCEAMHRGLVRLDCGLGWEF